MARKKRRQNNRRTQRVKPVSSLANKRLRSHFYRDKEPLHDLRRFHFEYPIAYTVGQKRADIGLEAKNIRKRQTKAKLQFVSPIRTVICIRRKIRRSVLFSQKKVGRGKAINPIRRLTYFSKIKC